MRLSQIARLLSLILGLAGAAPALAQDLAAERVWLGVGRLFVNDALGDGQDRWHSGAYTISVMRGPEGTRSLPEMPGALLEYRFANRILAPANTVTPKPGDRRYAGLLAFGAYSHFAPAGFAASLGAEVVASGPMTGVSWFHQAAHSFFGATAPSALVVDNQYPNALRLAAAGELSRPIALGQNTVLRPFVAGRWGDETYVRMGADLLIGSVFNTGVLVRDETTGLLYQTMEHAPDSGWSFLLGADTAFVSSSAWLPAGSLSARRDRMRAGLHYQTGPLGIFYGVARLGPEFSGQSEGQTLGALQFQLRF